MQHTLSDIAKDFPWTRVRRDNPPVEPWRKQGEGWFDGLPKGWADVLYEDLSKIDSLLQESGLDDFIYIDQVKEKWGSLRFYYDFIKIDDNGEVVELTEEEQKVVEQIHNLVWKMEEHTEMVCCDCGTTENVQGYGGWVHFACPECEKKRVAAWKEAVKEYKRAKNEE